MLVCPKCGLPVKEKDNFCEECGFNLRKAQTEGAVLETPTPTESVEININHKCLKCGNLYPRKYEYCPQCGTKYRSINYCNTCKEEFPLDYKYCPSCGRDFNVNRKAKPHNSEATQTIFNLVSKISIAVLSFFMLIFFLFFPIYQNEITVPQTISSEYSEDMIAVNIRHTGVEVLGYGIVVLSNYTAVEATTEFLKILDDIQINYARYDDEWLIAHYQEIMNEYDIYKINLFDDEETNNEVFKTQVLIAAIFTLVITMLLITSLVFSIISIFKREERSKMVILLNVIIFGLLMLMATIVRMPSTMSDSPTSIFGNIDYSIFGIGTIFVIMMIIINYALSYLLGIVNSKETFKIQKLIKPLISISVLILVICISTGTLATFDLKTSNTDEYMSYSYHITEQLPLIEISGTDLQAMYGGNNTEELLYSIIDRFNSLSEESLFLMYFAFPTDFNAMLSTLAMGTPYALVSYILFFILQIVLVVTLIKLLLSFQYPNMSKKDNHLIFASTILSLVMMVMIIIFASLFNYTMAQLRTDNVQVAMKVSANVVVSFIFLVGLTIYAFIIGYKNKKRNALN